MSDPVGTLRRSPEGVYALRCEDDPMRAAWSVSRDSMFEGNGPYRFLGDDAVAKWAVVFEPPPPPVAIGTIKRRVAPPPLGNHWAVAILTASGWVKVNRESLVDTEASDPDHADWEVIYEP